MMRSNIIAPSTLAVLCSLTAILAGAHGDTFWSQWDGVCAIGNAMACVVEIATPSDA